MISERFTKISATPVARARPVAATAPAAAGPEMILLALACLALVFVWLGIRPASAENPDISQRRAAERTTFTDDEIRDGFLKIALRAELQLDRPIERVRKFDEPVRIFVENKGSPDRRAEIARVVADIGARVNHLDVAITHDRQDANFVVTLVTARNFDGTIRAHYGSARAKQIQQSLAPQCLSGIGKDEHFRIRRAEVILPVDAGEFTFYDCAYEELLQALGAINDDRSVPWTMFNDDVQMGFFDIYDQYLLNILYDPRIHAGMTEQEVKSVLPDILSTARDWVGSGNTPSHADAKYRPAERHEANGAAAIDGSRVLR